MHSDQAFHVVADILTVACGLEFLKQTVQLLSWLLWCLVDAARHLFRVSDEVQVLRLHTFSGPDPGFGINVERQSLVPEALWRRRLLGKRLPLLSRRVRQSTLFDRLLQYRQFRIPR